ncbi:MAG TPA: class I SAM-dependent methyltransferase [Chryseosolibacter sp.]
MNQKFPYTWEEAIQILRKDPAHQELIFNAYLTDDLVSNCKRFASSEEFQETLKLIRKYAGNVKKVLDVPGGNGIATYAFASSGFDVTVVEPDASASVGRGAIQFVLDQASLKATIVEAFGENLPFQDGTFDVVYVRQGLHHAYDLNKMVSEYFRVLKKGGILLGCREHVVDNHGSSKEAFLKAQVDHQLYGGENAFTLKEYKAAFEQAGFELCEIISPYSSPINLFPKTPESLQEKILATSVGKTLSAILPRKWVVKIGMEAIKFAKLPGRMYSFVGKKA